MKCSNLLILLLLALFMGACQKGIDTFTPIDKEIIGWGAGRKITVSYCGRVTDYRGNTINNAKVICGTNTTVTDKNGIFVFLNMETDENHVYIKIEKQGYFTGSKVYAVQEGSANYAEIELLKKDKSMSFNSTTGGMVGSSEGFKINFSKGSIKNENGDVYNGNVNVYVKYLDPLNDATSDQMPGNVKAIDNNNIGKVLTGYGAILLELSGQAGEKLNFRDGYTAEISMPLSPSILAGAPLTIPLWYFDENIGLWKEEGQAVLDNGKYIGKIGHLASWNCGLPSNYVNLSAKIVDKDNNPIQGMAIKIKDRNNLVSGYAISDGAGNVKMLAPQNMDITLNVMDKCDKVIFSKQIGGLLNDQNLGTVEAALTNHSVHVYGKILNCDNNPVTDGYILLYNEFFVQMIPSTYQTGQFDGVIYNCTGDDIKAVVVDRANFKTGDEISKPSKADMNFGNLPACKNTIEYVTFTVDTETYTFFLPELNVNIPATEFYAFDDVDPAKGIVFFYDGQGTGSFTTGSVSSSIYINGDLYYNTDEDTNGLYIDINEFGNVNELVKGTFHGTLQKAAGGYYVKSSITGNFVARRKK